MASYFLPSFLSGWDLSSVSAFSLSANLQKRILSYLLKRTLGHLVDGGQLDLAQIDAGIGSGRIEVRNVQLDVEAINRRMPPSLPVALVAGHIGTIFIQLPVPNFWSGELSVTVSDVSIHFEPCPDSSSSSSHAIRDLSASFASAASQLFVEDEEARDLEQSIHESLEADQPNQTQKPSAEEGSSLVASYVEALLNRLKVAIENVQVHLQSETVDLSLKLKHAHVHSSNTRTEQQGRTPEPKSSQKGSSTTVELPHRRLFSETKRTLELQGFEIWLQDKRTQTKPKDSDSSYSSDDSIDGDTSARMHGTQDLEQSVASLQESSASLYESAVGESAYHETSEQHQDSAPSLTASKSELPSSAKSDLPSSANAGQLLFSLGQDTVFITLKTTKERHETIPTEAPSRRSIQRLVSIVTDVDVQIGTVGGIVCIDHVSLLMTLVRSLSRGGPQTETTPPDRRNQAQLKSSGARPQIQRDVALSCHVNSFSLIVGYDDPTSLQQDPSSLDAFWARPTRSHPDFGHIRLRCDKLSAHFTNAADSDRHSERRSRMKFTVDDVGLFEHLPTALYEQCPAEVSRVLPILILDPNLAQSGAASSAPAQQPRHNYAASSVDVFDWRYPAHLTAPHRPRAGSDTQISGKAARFKPTEARPGSSSSMQSPYVRTAYGDRGWKLKATAKTQTQGTAPEASPPSIVISVLLPGGQEDQGQVSATVAPVHLFVDVSFATRLMPALRRFATAQLVALRQTAEAEYDMAGSVATLAASVATIQASTDSLLDLSGINSAARKKSPFKLDLQIGFVRIDVRTPKISYDAVALAGRSLSSTRLAGLDRRSGILVLQVQRLQVQTGLSETHLRSDTVRFAASGTAADGWQRRDPAVTGQISAEKVSAFVALPSQPRALVLALIEAIRDNADEQGPFVSSRAPLLPRIQRSRVQEPGQTDHRQIKDRCSISTPSIKVELGKAQLDSLQYMADDLTQSINLWTSDDLDETDSLDAEGLKILGSRFFGSRAGMSVISASTDSTATARASSKNSSLLLTITESSIRLWLPSLSPDVETTDDRRTGSSKSLLLMTSDFELLFDSDKARNTTRIEIRLPEMQLSTEVGSAFEEVSSFPLAYRTMSRDQDDRGRNTMLLLVLEAYAEPGSSYREQNVDLTLCSVTLSPSFDHELIPRIKRLLKSPAGVFENVEPNEVTRISFKAKDCSILVAPANTDHRAAVAIGEASVKTKLTSHAPKTSIKLAIANLDLFVAEVGAPSVSSRRAHVARSASEHWADRGFARLLYIPDNKGSIHFNTLTRPEIDVKVTKLRVKIQATADTLTVVTGLVDAITQTQAIASSKSARGSTAQEDDLGSDHGSVHEKSAAPETSPSTEAHFDRMAELMSGIEDDAYRLAAPLSGEADLVDDDVPSDAAFLGAKGRYHPDIIETTLDSDEFFGGESVASLSLLAPRTDTVIFADEDVTVRLLDPKGICPVQEYFTNPDLRPHVDAALGSSASSVRVRVSNFDLSLRLHSGYDWPSTRKAVQREAKLVRKRLQKIKQLLAEGQVPDDSVEAATSNLLDSIHISLPNIPAEMGPDEMLRAVEDELGDHSDADSTADRDGTASWQTLPTVRRNQRGSRAGATAASTTTDVQHAKLQRSSRSLIDFSFRGVEVEFDKADPSQAGHVVSRIAVNARRFEIIDNIETSTWRTFLTEMQDRNAALRHDVESKMVKVEILYVRPGAAVGDGKSGSAGESEVRMRAKIAPLRLHVDQDALDFLKKFFTFKAPGHKETPPPVQSTSAPLPFVQFAEVLPIKIKLDYKPKRVDYNLLRQGKTIELMNFFHFEGSEMVLRHTTLRGINGWARLFDTLNDIWTPDVKANQLADFLSGLGPIRSLVNVGAGLADLVLLPIEQYHRDGRVLKGVQRGATSFAKSTALEAVKLGARLATGTQVILEQAEHVLGGERMRAPVTARAVGPEGEKESYESLSESIMVESVSAEQQGETMVSRYAAQPEDMRDALSQAYSGLTEGLTSAAQTILAIPMEVYEPDADGGRGVEGAARGRPVVKAVPIAILRGARGATQAIAKTMQGVQVTLGDLENVKEGKYKLPGPQRR
ncbi:hypothetical protein EX895_006035 [Sporisorium graminicola]|uniref:Autophagy-related protein 2 n=1 Tax=Sporisorium graminicola TaxID=280036 RepID=A0A4U7KL38_9BASI|nr:hypothetical protein EX895_006035 [Sporisorium graminicola]TKY84955.1 hypothetical protein EX895_006035 [Sporisorium graminicola]